MGHILPILYIVSDFGFYPHILDSILHKLLILLYSPEKCECFLFFFKASNKLFETQTTSLVLSYVVWLSTQFSNLNLC